MMVMQHKKGDMIDIKDFRSDSLLSDMYKLFTRKEAKMIILHKKGDMRDLINYRHIILLFHMCKLFTWIL